MGLSGSDRRDKTRVSVRKRTLMYPGSYAQKHPHRPAVIMAATGAIQTYAQLEARSNQLAHALRAFGLERLDHYAIFMENNAAYIETCAAGERAGLFYTCINSFLTAEEMAYIVTNSESKVLITSLSKLALVQAAIKDCPTLEQILVVDSESLPLEALMGQPLAITTRSFHSILARRSRMSLLARRCCIPRAQRVVPRGSFGHCQSRRQMYRFRSTVFYRNFGFTGRTWCICHQPPCITPPHKPR